MSDNLFKQIKGVELSQSENDDLKDHLSLMRDVVDFTVGLNTEERFHLATINRGNKLFVEDIDDAINSFPQLLPGFITQSDWEAAWNLYQQMEDFETETLALVNQFRHTRILAGAMLYKDARSVYQALKEAYDRGMPGVGPFYHRAMRRFEGQRLASNAENPDQVASDETIDKPDNELPVNEAA